MTRTTMEDMRSLKYLGYSVVFQEVPDEISLAINISGCPYRCEGCHSSYLWEYEGRYLKDDLEAMISKFNGITCVCFMGGDQNANELNAFINYIHSQGLKVCLYTGRDSVPCDVKNLDYIKIGHYAKECGGLDSPTTNQKFYAIKNNKYIDQTFKFRKEIISAENYKEPMH